MDINAGEAFLSLYATDEPETFEVKLPSGKPPVKVRALTRLEALNARKEKETPEFEQKLCALCMVEPKLTEKQVARWQEVSPAGDIEVVSRKVLEVSGFEERPGKSSLPEVGE